MEPWLADQDFTLYHGDALDVLRTLPDASVHCCVTSPPYWGLRDYGHDGQLGLEQTPDEYVARMVEVFREVRRVLRDDGTLWLNLGDSYAANRTYQVPQTRNANHDYGASNATVVPAGLKPKDLVGIPWRVAFALQADGWWFRSDIIWAKPNPMPESVTDRPTKAHEYVFLLSKSARYFFDQEAVREPAEWNRWGDQTVGKGSNPNGWIKPKTKAELTPARRKPLVPEQTKQGVGTQGVGSSTFGHWAGERCRNIRSVWEIATQPYAEAHFATYPQELVRRCILAGCPEWVCGTCGKARERITEHGAITSTGGSATGARATNMDSVSPLGQDPHSGAYNTGAFVAREKLTTGWSDCGHDNYRPGTVLDPFLGSGTTALVARNHGRRSIGIELNADYCQLAADRLAQQSLLA